MPSFKIGRTTEDIRRELSAIQRELKDPRVQTMISITRVETTGDLRYAKVYISVLEKDRGRDVLKGLKSAAGYLRRELGAAVQLRYTPQLEFVADDSIQHGAHILQMLRDPNVVKPANPANEHIVLDDEE